MPRAGSLFSGIGGGDLGLERAGWEIAWQVENEPFCNRILERHWPNVKRYGDITGVDPAGMERVDLIIGGFPCQDLSVAGKREGLAGSRSSLFWEMVRFAGALRPRWLLIENVPGLRSSPPASPGRDFAVVLSALDELGYGVGGIGLDSQYFGVAQRRERVFLVGHLGAPCPPEVLFDAESLRRDPPAGIQAGQELPPALRRRFDSSSRDGRDVAFALTGHHPRDSSEDNYAIQDARDIGDKAQHAVAFNARQDPIVGKQPIDTDGHSVGVLVAPTIRAPDANAPRGPDGKRRDGGPGERIPLIGTTADPIGVFVAGETGPGFWQPGVRALRAEGENRPSRPSHIVGTPADSVGVRETPGVPGSLDPATPDSPRYRALGNAMTVPVVSWLGRRLLDA